MAAMNPVLRLRRAFRSVAGPQPRSEEQAEEVADEAADAITSYSYSQRESDLRYAQMMAEMREFMTQQTNRILLGTLAIATLVVAILTIVIVALD